MRKIVAEIVISLDGFIEDVNGNLDWLVAENEIRYTNSFLKEYDTFFYGRKAYERFKNLHLVHESNSPSESDAKETLTTMRKYVFSRTKMHVEGNAMVVRSNMMSEARRIKDERGKNILLCGGAVTIQQFAKADLIDEYIIAIQPIVLGGGKPLFKSFERMTLNLKKAEKLNAGTVIMHYLPDTRNYFQ